MIAYFSFIEKKEKKPKFLWHPWTWKIIDLNAIYKIKIFTGMSFKFSSKTKYLINFTNHYTFTSQTVTLKILLKLYFNFYPNSIGQKITKHKSIKMTL